MLQGQYTRDLPATHKSAALNSGALFFGFAERQTCKSRDGGIETALERGRDCCSHVDVDVVLDVDNLDVVDV